MTIIDKFKLTWNSLLRGNENKYNQALYSMLGQYTNAYEQNINTLLTKGYMENPDVNAIINMQASKTTVVPFVIKKVIDEKSVKQIKNIGNNPTHTQKTLIKLLDKKAYSEEDLPMPLPKPNPNQSWSDIMFLYKVFLKVTGNVYLYILKVEEGKNAGTPMQVYVLPSNWMQIVLKPNANLLSFDNPIDYYIMEQANQLIRFEVDSVIHIKRANPFYDQSGRQLYGHSELMAGIRNINSSNNAIDNNGKTMLNSGVYGFIHAGDGNTPLTPEQADSLKDRLIKMDNDPSRLSNIAGSSAKIGFTRISLTTAELQPFEYLAYDRKTLCNLLNWPDELMNNDTNSGLNSNNEEQARKRAITDNIKPDLDLLADSLNEEFIQKFKGYENVEIIFDISELPEMQTDMGELVDWLNKAPLTPNERRIAINYPELLEEGMDDVWQPSTLVNINDITLNDINNGQAQDRTAQL